MNKSKKGLLTAGSIVSIIGSAFAIIGSLVSFFLGAIFNEEFIKETYLSEPEIYTYYEDTDGSYYFVEMVDGVQVITYEEDIELAAKMVNVACIVSGFIGLGFAVAKLVLAIRVLIKNSRNEYAKGATITLLVLTALCFNWVEAVLYLIAICQKTNEGDNNTTNNNQINDVETINVQ